jgi:hypothetical protein
LEEALGHIDLQLDLVNHRASELEKLREELSATRKRVRRKLREQGADERHSGTEAIAARVE